MMEELARVSGLTSTRIGQNMAWTVLHLTYSLDSGGHVYVVGFLFISLRSTLSLEMAFDKYPIPKSIISTL